MRPGQLRIRLMSLLESGIRVSFATRLFDLSHGFRAASADPVLFLRPERRDNGERTFRLLEGERLPTGYGPRTLPAGLRHGAESCHGRTREALGRGKWIPIRKDGRPASRPATSGYCTSDHATGTRQFGTGRKARVSAACTADALRDRGIAAAALFKPSMDGWIVQIYPGGIRRRA